MIGITSYGAYIPRLRLERMAIFQAMGWFAPALMMVAQGERSMCNWDEDAITMAVAAARDCLRGMALDRAALNDLFCRHAKEKEVLLANALPDLHVRTIECADGRCTVQRELHVASAGSFLARS